MLERVKEIIEEQLNIEDVEITEATRFKEDLEADSLDLFAIFFLYQVFRFILGRYRKVQVMQLVPAGVYVVLMLVALAFGDCYIDFIMMLGGTVIAIAGVFLTLKQYKRSMNEDF